MEPESDSTTTGKRGLKKVLRSTASSLVYRSYFGLVRGIEKHLGGSFLPLLITPIALLDCLRRRQDYGHFKVIRKVLPDRFWKDMGPAEHYFRMLYFWHTSVFCGILYDRWGSERLSKYVKVIGTPPEQLPGFATRPVVVSFLHTGAFGFLRPWIRSRKIKAVSYGSVPRAGAFADKLHHDGDVKYGTVGLPQYLGPRDLRAVSKHLAPSHVLMIAIDGAQSLSPDPIPVGDHTMHLHDGPVRFALKSGAVLMPAWIKQTGSFRFEIHFGRPVPDELMDRANTKPAVEWLAKEFWAGLVDDPAAVGWTTLEALAPDKAINRSLWP